MVELLSVGYTKKALLSEEGNAVGHCLRRLHSSLVNQRDEKVNWRQPTVKGLRGM